MAIKGQQRVQADYSKKVGFDEFEIIAINPTKEELEEILNISDMKEPVYLTTGQDKGGNDIARTTVVIWMKGKNSSIVTPERYMITKAPRVNKDGTLTQYINDIGDTAWAKDEATLRANAGDMTLKETARNFYKQFTARSFRVAYNGEDKLFNFLQKWTNIDTRDMGTEITLNIDKLFKGNFGEIQDLLDSEYKDNTVCTQATVRVVPSTDPNAAPGSFKEYQSLYEEVLPGSYIRYFQEGVRTIPDYVKKYIDNMTGEYGTKDFYFLGPIKDYSSNENPAVREFQRIAAVQSGAVPATNTADVGPKGSPTDDLPF